MATRSVNKNISDVEDTHLQDVSNTSKDIMQTPTTIYISRHTTTPKRIATSSSINDWNNNREETNIKETQSKMSTPYLKPAKSQGILTIDNWDQSPRQEITTLENDNWISAPKEPRITTEDPATIAIVSKPTSISRQINPTRPLYKTKTHRDPNNNIQADSKNDLHTRIQESTMPTHQTTPSGRGVGTLHRLAPTVR
jgi:hypothetical protein